MNNSGYRITFDVDGFDKSVVLPVNPNEVTVAYPGNNSNYDVEGIGEIIVPRLPKLASVSFESFFPRVGVTTPMANGDSWYTPEWYLTFFRRLQRRKEPFRLTITRGSDVYYDYNNGMQDPDIITTDHLDTTFDQAMILDISITDKGGEPGDLYYTMSISEYRDASPQKLAEISKQTLDDDGNILSQQMVTVPVRPIQRTTLFPGQAVTVNGRVYTAEDQAQDTWDQTKQRANQLDRLITRVLPPSVSNKLHSVYIQGLGWVDKSSCSVAETKGTLGLAQGVIRDD